MLDFKKLEPGDWVWKPNATAPGGGNAYCLGERLRRDTYVARVLHHEGGEWGTTKMVLVLDDTMITNQRDQILKLAAAHSLPVIARYADFAEAGALVAYGPSLPALYRRAAQYVDRILKGASPGELPIEEPKQFEMIVNLRTARALGLAIPRSVLLSADRTIE